VTRWWHHYRNEGHVWLLFSQHRFEGVFGAEAARKGRLREYLRRHIARFNPPRRAF